MFPKPTAQSGHKEGYHLYHTRKQVKWDENDVKPFELGILEILSNFYKILQWNCSNWSQIRVILGRIDSIKFQ